MAMKVEQVEMLWQAITAIEAQKMLVDMEVMQCIELAKSKKTIGRSNKLHRNIHRMAYPPALQKTISIEQFANMLGDQSG